VTVAALAERPRPVDAPSRARQLDSRSGGGRLTLEQLLDSVWEGLRADGAAECPVCGEHMARTASGGECGGCGSTLA
jgi:hypothetical protein